MRVHKAFSSIGKIKQKILRPRCYGCGTTKKVGVSAAGTPTCVKCRQTELLPTVGRPNPVHQ